MHSHGYYAGIYALFQISALISLVILGVALLIFSVKRAGASLHQEALRTLIQAPLRFFTNTDTGVVTNLFSQDLNLIDTELPESTLNTLFCVSLHDHHALEIMKSDTKFAGFSSTRTSGCYAYILCVLGHQLPVPRRPLVCAAKVLLTDFQTAAAA